MSGSAERAEVGFVGLGAMGSAIAGRLLDAGFPLVVCDREAAAVSPFHERGAAVCATPVEVAERCETVLVSLPTPDVVRAVAVGPGGLIEGRAMRTLGDLSTTGRPVAVEIAAILERRGIDYLDAPVSGGVAGAHKGTLGVFVGAEEAIFERCRPLLEAFGATIVRVGSEPGQGQVAKLLNNLLSATALAITAEALTLGVADGLDPEALLAALNAGTGRNSATATKFPEHVLTRSFATGFRLELMLKDVRLALDEARAQGQPMLIGSVVEQLWTVAAQAAAEGADHSEVVRLFEDWSGVTVEGNNATTEG